jgi:hypothetical protein
MNLPWPKSVLRGWASNEKANCTGGWAPRSNEEAVVATAESLVRLGLLKDSSEKEPRLPQIIVRPLCSQKR